MQVLQKEEERQKELIKNMNTTGLKLNNRECPKEVSINVVLDFKKELRGITNELLLQALFLFPPQKTPQNTPPSPPPKKNLTNEMGKPMLPNREYFTIKVQLDLFIF